MAVCASGSRKRVKLRAGVLGSPVQATVSSSSTSSTAVRTAPFVPSASAEVTHNDQSSFRGKRAVLLPRVAQ